MMVVVRVVMVLRLVTELLQGGQWMAAGTSATFSTTTIAVCGRRQSAACTVGR